MTLLPICRGRLYTCVMVIVLSQVCIFSILAMIVRSLWTPMTGTLVVTTHTTTTASLNLTTTTGPGVHNTSSTVPSTTTTYHIPNPRREHKHFVQLETWMSSVMKTGERYAFSSNIKDWFSKGPKTGEEFPLPPPEDMTYYLTVINSLTCYISGVDLRKNSSSHCVCKSGWYGDQCSSPPAFSQSQASPYIKTLQVRSQSRRLINAITFNIEFDLLEIRLHELADVVDLFIIYESNYTLFGDPKPLRLLERLISGYLEEFHHKILYLYNGVFPVIKHKDGWYPEHYGRLFLGREGLRYVRGLKLDDLFLYLDADELPTKESLLFLKHHNGYPEPFGFELRWSVYGFFWKQDTPTQITAGCSVRMFRYIFKNDAQKLRSDAHKEASPVDIQLFLKESNTGIQNWNMAEHCGWHCSWCLKSEDIRLKLISAVNADFPRWGSYPEKLKLPYIRNLVKNGVWFDDTTRYKKLIMKDEDENFAPRYVLENSAKYGYLIDIRRVR